MFFLCQFNDMLLVCNEQSILGTKYKMKHNIDLEEAQVNIFNFSNIA